MTWDGENTPPTRLQESLYGRDSPIDGFLPQEEPASADSAEPTPSDNRLASVSNQELRLIIDQAHEIGDDDTAALCAAELEARQAAIGTPEAE